MTVINPKNEAKIKKKRFKKSLYWVLFCFIIIYTFFFTRYNLLNYYQTKRDNRHLRSELEWYKINNEELRLLIVELRDNPEAWERIARERFGMQKPDEVIIKFEKED